MKKKLTFSKWLVILCLLFFVSCIVCSYILAFTGHEHTMEELASQIIIVGIGTILGYFCKAFFETREEERIRLEREKLGLEEENME